MEKRVSGGFGSFFLRLFAAVAIVAALVGCGTGRSAVGVEDFPGPLLDLTVRFPPSKTEYYVGELFTPQGIVVEGRYANSGVRQIPLAQLSFTGFDSSTPVEQQQITVSFHGLSAWFVVVIYAPKDLEGDI